MDRRAFFRNSLASATLASTPAAAAKVDPGRLPGRKTWLFWDLWKLDGIQGVALKQGRPQWCREATYRDPAVEGFSTWPLVYKDSRDGLWRMIYTAKWLPYTLMVAASRDGLSWQPEPHPEIIPPGAEKIAANHLFTLPNGSGGGPYYIEKPADGNHFRIFAIQHGIQAYSRARQNPQSYFHSLSTKTSAGKRYFVDHLSLVSKDGINWKADFDAVWNQPGWHPEPPVYAFYNERLGTHFMTSRPGHGERRVVIQSSPDARSWSGPELLLQPDSLDVPLVQFYGMPVVPYEGHFVGLLWHFHIADSHPVDRYNHYIGPLECYLAYSYDGRRFSRGLRQPFIGLNEPSQPGCGVIQTSCMVDCGDELRFYSSACELMHGLSERDGKGVNILVHRLRRDGFMYLESVGNWGSITSKPIVLFSPEIEINASAPHGQVLLQLTDVKCAPIPGFAFDDCTALRDADNLRWKVSWKGGAPPLHKVLRLEVELRHARLYSVRADSHFIDAQDQLLLDDGQSIDPRWFDY